MFGSTGKSPLQRSTIVATECVFLLFSYWFLFMDGNALLGLPDGNSTRDALLFGCCLITFIRMSYMVVFLLRRGITWRETWGVIFAFACYYVGLPLLGGIIAKPLGWWDGAAVGLFIAGSVINSLSEILRDRWKKDERNRGRLYTGGLFRYAVHVNYFGDVLWVLGLAWLTGNAWSILMPILLALMFILQYIPEHDRYLRSKYGKDFEAYEKKTKKLFPYIY